LIDSLLAFVLGSAVGSFLNVVVYRLPEGISLLFPPSRCPYCYHRLKPYENVPIVGWLFLRGQCSSCRTSISIRYPLVELATGLLFVLVFAVYGWSWQTLGYWFFVSWLLSLSLIDLDTMTLPHPLTKWGLIAGLVFQIITGWLLNYQWVDALEQLSQGVIAAVIGIWAFDFIRIAGTVALGQDAMGGGDAKLTGMIGAWLGWKMMLVGVALAFVVGAVVGLGGKAIGQVKQMQPVPFGPSLAMGALLATLFGETIIKTYLEWMGLT
jgi:leader peptidase (prepilin peptidase) / N-methyltransferase